MKQSEKLVLLEIFEKANQLCKAQRGMEIGHLFSMIRKYLGMSQKILAKRAGVPQSTISRIETGQHSSNHQTLNKVSKALFCDLQFSVIPTQDLDAIRYTQARTKAERKIRYLQGTMSLEDQEPDRKLMELLIDEECSRLLQSSSARLWDES